MTDLHGVPDDDPVPGAVAGLVALSVERELRLLDALHAGSSAILEAADVELELLGGRPLTHNAAEALRAPVAVPMRLLPSDLLDDEEPGLPKLGQSVARRPVGEPETLREFIRGHGPRGDDGVEGPAKLLGERDPTRAGAPAARDGRGRYLRLLDQDAPPT